MESTEEQNDRASQLYRRYGKPLERERRGEYLAVSGDGKTLVAPSLEEAIERSIQAFGPGSHVFHIGDQAVFTWMTIHIS